MLFLGLQWNGCRKNKIIHNAPVCYMETIALAAPATSENLGLISHPVKQIKVDERLKKHAEENDLLPIVHLESL